MKLIIDIPYGHYCTIKDGFLSECLQATTEAIVNGVEIPDNATNGDMIKALFPNAEFDNAMPFTDGRWETMNLDTENRTRAIYKPTQLRTYADWWNSPYKKGDTE
jgi:hypothetical protein